MYLSRVAATTSSGSSGPGGVLSQPEADSQSRTYCLSYDGWGPPGAQVAAGQTSRQGHAADDAGGLVVGEPTAGEVAAGDALDGHHVELADDDAATLELRCPTGELRRHDVVRHHVGELLEPPQRQPGQHR